jgi:prepilin-type N-terminal cleavage/methylation domain-containing protein
MVRKMYTLRSKLHDEKGFTLIEMAIVLVIIGIIIGAVVKGKDVMKNAEQKRLYTTYVREWQVAYNNYYDRTGRILGDDITSANTTRDGRCGNGGVMATAAVLNNQLTYVGLNPPAVGPTNVTNVRTYTDAWGRQYTLTLQLNNNATFGNFIQITSATGIPFDLGLAWDRIVDGTSVGNTGDLLYIPNTGSPTVAAAWPTNASVAPAATSAIFLRLEF